MSDVTRIGDHMRLRQRRVVYYWDKPASFRTALGQLDGLADGVILVRELDNGPTADPSPDARRSEMTVAEARAAIEALHRCVFAIERWHEKASGVNRIRVRRDPDGSVWVTHRGRTRPMRLSKLRGSKRLRGVPSGDSSGRTWVCDGFYRRCAVCRACPHELWVAADDLREQGNWKVPHVEVCHACVDKLANQPENLREA